MCLIYTHIEYHLVDPLIFFPHVDSGTSPVEKTCCKRCYDSTLSSLFIFFPAFSQRKYWDLFHSMTQSNIFDIFKQQFVFISVLERQFTETGRRLGTAVRLSTWAQFGRWRKPVFWYGSREWCHATWSKGLVRREIELGIQQRPLYRLLSLYTGKGELKEN